VAPAHDHPLNDPVALGDLVLNFEPEFAERLVEAPRRLLDALGTARMLGVRGLVVREVRVNEFVRELEMPVS
jgi:hypothetical protein